MTRNIKNATLDLLHELRSEAQKKFNEAYDKREFDGAQVTKVQVSLLSASIDAIEYAMMLDNRATLKTESFLIEKIGYMIRDLENAQARIKAESKYDE